MKTILPFGAALLAGLMVASCGSSFDFKGQWIGMREQKAPKGERLEIWYTLTKIDLTIKPNGRFELINAGLPFEGAWRTSGEKAYLKIDSVMARPIEESGYAEAGKKEIELTPKPNGTIDYFDPGGYDEKPINLKRESKP